MPLVCRKPGRDSYGAVGTEQVPAGAAPTCVLAYYGDIAQEWWLHGQRVTDTPRRWRAHRRGGAITPTLTTPSHVSDRDHGCTRTAIVARDIHVIIAELHRASAV